MLNFLNISDFSKEQIISILDINKFDQILQNKSIGLIFEKYSTRTRLSFKVGIHQLGGNAIDIKFEELNISRDESFEDTFLALQCYLDGIVYRTSNHQRLISSSKFFKKPIINALSEVSHPCQIISDLFTLKENFGHLNLNILWCGDINNVCFSLIEAVNLFEEISLTIYSHQKILNKINITTNKNIYLINKLNDIDLKEIDCVMTDVFISMNDENSTEKQELLKPYIVTKDIIEKTSSKSVFMHCLPAKVGSEVSKEVFYSERSIVWKQAYNRMVAQKKLLQFIYQ